MALHRVAAREALAHGAMLCVDVAGRDILLCRTADGVYALDNLCTHAAARLCEGRLKGNRILCPLHGAAFDARTGAPLSLPAREALRVYPVQLQGEDILVEIAE